MPSHFFALGMTSVGTRSDARLSRSERRSERKIQKRSCEMSVKKEPESSTSWSTGGSGY